MLEEFVVIVRAPNGRGRRQFTYYVDPRKKPNAESVLRDFRHDSQIEDERDWRLCTLSGKEIRWLADYADRVLVLEPSGGGGGSPEAMLPRLGSQSPKLINHNRSPASSSGGYELDSSGSRPSVASTKIMDSESPDHRLLSKRKPRSDSSSILSVISSTPKLPSLSTSMSSGIGSNASSSGGSGGGGGGGVGGKRNPDRLARPVGLLPKPNADTRPSYAERNGKSEHRRERSR